MANNALLLEYCKVFDTWKATAHPEYFLHRKQIEEFFERNKLSIDFYNTNIERIDKEYMIYENDKPKIVNGGGVFKDETKKEEYETKIKEVFERPIKIILNGYTI